MTRTKLDTEKILQEIAEMRAALIPEQHKLKPKPRPSEETRMPRRINGDPEWEFEIGAIADAVGAFRDELAEVIAAFDAEPG